MGAVTTINIAPRRRLAWLVPLGVAGLVASGAAIGAAGSSGATPTLPTLTAHQLLSRALQHAGRVTALSGTVREVASLGLPSLPGDFSSTQWSWQTFVTGAHELRVQVDGPQRQRIALLGQLAEADVVHNGRDLWTYTSDTNTVTHIRLPRHAAERVDAGDSVPANLTPGSVASDFLRAVTPSTAVTVRAPRQVAGRAAYTLVLRPRDARSTVRKVTLALDSTTFVPLQVEVFGAAHSPAFQTGFTKISFATPSASAFNFRMPAGAVLGHNPFGRASEPTHRSRPSHQFAAGRPEISVSGTAWTSVVEIRMNHAVGSASSAALPLGELTSPIGRSGDRLVRTALINAVIRPDGTVFVAAMRPEVLEHAATRSR